MDDHAAVVAFSYILATYLLSCVCTSLLANQPTTIFCLFLGGKYNIWKVRHENRRKDPLWWLVVEEKDGER
jgi:hypothetical protein